MSGQGAKSKSDNESQFDQNVWGPSGDALKQLYGQVGDLFSQNPDMQKQMQSGRDTQQSVIGDLQTPWQQQMQGGAYKDLNIGNNLQKSLSQSLNSPSAMQDINSMIMGGSGNNYADAMKQSYVNDADTATQNMLRNLDSRATASGMSGGAGYGTAVGQGMKDINTNLQRNLAQTGFGAFDKDLDRKLNIAQQADQNNFGRQQLMSNMLGDKQGAMTGGLNFGGNMFDLGQQQQMTPWQQAGQYAQSIGGPQVLSSGSGSGSGKSLSGGGGVGGSKGGGGGGGGGG